MSTSCGWEGKGRYASFRLRMNVWVYTVQVILWNPLRTRVIPECFCMKRRGGAISSVCTFTFRMCLFWTLLELRIWRSWWWMPFLLPYRPRHNTEGKIKFSHFVYDVMPLILRKIMHVGLMKTLFTLQNWLLTTSWEMMMLMMTRYSVILQLPVLLDVLVARPLHLSRAVSSNWNWFHNKATQLPIVYTAGVCCYL